MTDTSQSLARVEHGHSSGDLVRHTDSDQCGMYHRLSPSKREFRLIRFRPNGANYDLSCEMAVVSLDDDISYTALSYRWLTEDPTCTMWLRNSRFPIRPNLASILRTLQSEDFDGWLFVDAICINQSDLAEKATQVVLMGVIYGKATQVVAWVNTKPLVVEREELVQDYCSGKIDLFEQLRAGEESSLDAMVSLYEAIVDVFVDCDYWSRVWIVQEVVLSTSLVIRSGRFQIQADLLLGILDLVQTSNMDTNLLHTLNSVLLHSPSMFASPARRKKMYAFQAWKILSRRSTRIMGSRGELGLPIADVVTFFSVQDCSVRHDKVFGLFGLSRLHFTPDYSQSILELYLRVLNEGLYVGSGSRGDEVEPIDRQQIFDLIGFIIVLRVALDIPPLHPVGMLLTRETFRGWGAHKVNVDLMDTLASVSTRPGWWASTRYYVKSRWVRLSLSVWQRTSKAMPALSSDSERKTYAEWAAFAKDIFNDVQARMDQDVFVSASFKERLKMAFEKPLAQRGIWHSLITGR